MIMTSERRPATLFTNCPWENRGIESKASSKYIGNYKPQENVSTKPVDLNPESTGVGFDATKKEEEIFKAFIPWFLYKPPYGFPRNTNPLQLRQFAKNPYIFGIIKTLSDEICAVPYDVVLREEFLEEGYEEDREARKQIIGFFDNPNGNEESFEHILRCWVKDVCEIGNFVGVKVFNGKGQFSQLFARDAGTFLLNPDIYGYMGNRVEFVPQPTQYILTGGLPKNLHEQMQGASSPKEIDKIHDNVRNEQYDVMYRDSAAYFQYGWTAGARPVPFGKREIMWGGLIPRTNNIYHQSPIEVIYNQILTLVYGSEYNLDFYLNNNLPNGLLTLRGASAEQAKMYREQMQDQFMDTDTMGNYKKKHFKIPITGYEAVFTQMQMSSKEMEVIEQQKWFTKIIWSVFGVNAEEMGFTEDSNKAISETQGKIAKRKAIKPFIKMIEYVINNQLMPEFGRPEYKFKFIEYDLEEDKAKHDLWEQEIRMGIRTPRQIAIEELGISEEDFDNAQQQKQEQQQEFNDENNDENDEEDDDDKWGTKAIKTTELEKKIIKELKELEQKIIQEVEINQTGLAEIKGFIDYKAITQETLDKYKGFLNTPELKQTINEALGKEFSKGVEKIEKKLDRNVVVSTQDINTITDFAFNNIKGMNQDLIDNLRKQITMALLNKENLSQIKKRVKEQFDISENRARAIVQTETNRIYGTGSYNAAKQSGVEFYKYINATEDKRTSEICKDLDAKYGTPKQAIPIDDKFKLINGKEELHNPFHVNCRSVTLYIPKDEVKKGFK